jgi:hypothetical protein
MDTRDSSRILKCDQPRSPHRIDIVIILEFHLPDGCASSAAFSANTARRSGIGFRHFSGPLFTLKLWLTSCALQPPCEAVSISELEPAICDFEDWSISVRTDSIWLSGMGPGRTRIFDNVCQLLSGWRLSCELKMIIGHN